MTTQTEPTKLKWHKAKYGGEWEADYLLPFAWESYDNKTAMATIIKEDGTWGFYLSEDYDTDGASFKTLREAKVAAQEAVDSNFWSSLQDEAEQDSDYLRFKAETITMKQEYLDSWAA
jgi:hypothetical protein